MGLRISHRARRRFGLGADAVGPDGELHVPTLYAARVLAQSLNDRLGESVFTAGRLNALSRLERAVRATVALYLKQQPETWLRALEALEAKLGDELGGLLELFRSEYLSPDSERSDAEPDPALAAALAAEGSSADVERVHLLHELFIFSLIDTNPAAAALVGPLHESDLAAQPAYPRLVAALAGFFEEQPPLAGRDRGLLELLEQPSRRFPDSLADQLRFLLDEWSDVLGEQAPEIVAGLDLIAEEEAPRFPPGPGPVEVPSFADLDTEEENYSLDLDWMPRTVLIAKNTYVWLAQLSRSYGRPIERLDQIPEAELAGLAESGFTGLWLIGLWQRSEASRRIKELMGNRDAAASAYSLADYRISGDLGGEESLLALKERAWKHGVRLAADMVPNHMGIDSKWVVEHPDWFVSLPRAPFPVYSFEGPDLSSHPDVGIYLEDHYYDHSDAAVVFKHIDRTTGVERYIYHGNDGTTMPWNDTAQLDYLQPQVREAVIDNILRVARLFPIIRFDAAMTLARKHFQRLWYPEPGTGGAIPSRSEHGLTSDQLLRRMPREFWREVVERVAEEAPDTLLLAEAFWLMEGYFVRTLGMHRVYNSAFMNMLRDRENAKYRGLIGETLAFDPGILERHVNFLSNPDERTAIDQFGSEDRYFGACTLLATLPGLPMFAHGQVDGFEEKYGMEFRRPRLDEEPDEALRERHRREIFPLLRRRGRFAGAEDFHLFDFRHRSGDLDENVLAYGNGPGDRRIVVVFNNHFAAARGRLTESAPRRVAEGESDRQEAGVPIGKLLGLSSSPRVFCRFREAVSGVEYLQPSRRIRERGLELELGAFKYRVLSGFTELAEDAEGTLGRISRHAALAGVPSLEEAMLEDRRRPLVAALGEWLRRSMTADSRGTELRREPQAATAELEGGTGEAEAARGELEPVARQLDRLGLEGFDREAWIEATGAELGAVDDLSELAGGRAWPKTRRMRAAARRLAEWLAGAPETRHGLRAAVLVRATARALGPPPGSLERQPWLGPALRDGGVSDLAALRTASLVAGALAEDWLAAAVPPGGAELIAMVEGWTRSDRWRSRLAHSQAAERAWLGKEELDDLLLWRAACGVWGWLAGGGDDRDEAAAATAGWVDALELLRSRAERANYRVDRILAPAPAGAATATG